MVCHKWQSRWHGCCLSRTPGTVASYKCMYPLTNSHFFSSKFCPIFKCLVLSSSPSLNFRQTLSSSSSDLWLCTAAPISCAVSSGALRIRQLRGNGSSDGWNDFRIRTKGSVSVFTVGYKWALKGTRNRQRSLPPGVSACFFCCRCCLKDWDSNMAAAIRLATAQRQLLESKFDLETPISLLWQKHPAV